MFHNERERCLLFSKHEEKDRYGLCEFRRALIDCQYKMALEKREI